MSEDKGRSVVTTQGEEFRKISNQAPADGRQRIQGALHQLPIPLNLDSIDLKTAYGTHIHQSRW